MMSNSAGLPVIEGVSLHGLTGEWHLWEGWCDEDPALVRRLDEQRYVAVASFIFTFGVLVGQLALSWVYDDRWCYGSAAAAIAAATGWDGEGEPEGWHRHPSSGRRRPDGDKAREYVHY